jgi:chemotaxis protein MotA
MNFATFIGIFIGIGAILLGNFLEGGHLSSLMQLTAALIVFGGTFGAVFVSSGMKEIKRGFRHFSRSFFDTESAFDQDIQEVMECARIAKKESVLALERVLAQVKNDFFRDVMQTVIDGFEPGAVKEIYLNRIQKEEDEIHSAAKIWSDAGGFSPTIGIIGAVLGLIHVMNNLTDPTKLGPGIAVAFVATIYGVGVANLIFIPISNKIKMKAAHQVTERLALLEGALMIGASLNPKVIEQKLKSYMDTDTGSKAA